jgi:hypothetical protein
MLKSSVEGRRGGLSSSALRRSLRMSRRKLELGESEGRQSFGGGLSALQPARRVECSLQLNCQWMVPLGF